MNRKEAFKILEIPENASLKEISSAYRKLAKKWHPDINKSKEATEKFKQINNAYDILCGKTPPSKVYHPDDTNNNGFRYAGDFEDIVFNHSSFTKKNVNIDDILKTFYGQEKKNDIKYKVVLELSLENNSQEEVDKIVKILVANNIKVKSYSSQTFSSYHF